MWMRTAPAGIGAWSPPTPARPSSPTVRLSRPTLRTRAPRWMAPVPQRQAAWCVWPACATPQITSAATRSAMDRAPWRMAAWSAVPGCAATMAFASRTAATACSKPVKAAMTATPRAATTAVPAASSRTVIHADDLGAGRRGEWAPARAGACDTSSGSAGEPRTTGAVRHGRGLWGA